MKLSKYTAIFPHHSEKDSFIIFSTKNAAIVEVPKSLLCKIKKGAVTGIDKMNLLDLGLLVEDPKAERKELLGYVDEINGLSKDLAIKLVMNLDCNLACTYCFEGQRKGRHYLSQKKADEFVSFVKTRLDAGDFEGMRMSFYGGEPLLSLDSINYIAMAINTETKKRGLKYQFLITTNGTLLTPKAVEKLKPLGMKSAIVTLDGPKDLHDKSRPRKSGGGSFDSIVKNLDSVCGEIEIELNGNFTRDNYRRYPELLDHLISRGLTPKRLSAVSFSPVTAETPEFSVPDFNDGMMSMDEPWYFDAAVFLREEILRRGYKSARIAPGLCMMEFENGMVVNYDGTIYKCPGLIGRHEFLAGDIESGVKDCRISHNLDNWKKKECLDCRYLPLCFGGCRYARLVREGNVNGTDCKKKFFDATLEAMVRQDMKYGLIEE